MKKIFILINCLLCTLILNAKNISDEKAQEHIDKIISEKISKFKNEEKESETMLLSSNVKLQYMSTWEDVYNTIMENIVNPLIPPIEFKQKYLNISIEISKKPFTKNDMILNYVFIDDIKMTGLEIAKFTKELSEEVCYPSNYSFNDNSILYQSNKPGKYFCENNTNYQELLKSLDNLSKIGGEIYEFSYAFEKNNFIKRNKLDLSKQYALVETLFNYMNIIPNKESIYHLENIKAMQNVKDGVLVKGSSIFSGDIHPDKVAIIYTKNKFVTNENMYSYGYVKFVGTYDYVSTLGINQTIYAYKFIDINKLTNNLYFYPKLKEHSEVTIGFNSLTDHLEFKIDGKEYPFKEFMEYIEKLKK